MDEKELQGQIAVFLKTRFKGKEVEREISMQEGSKDSRNFLDILVDNTYALEVKLPTTRTQLRNLKGQLEEYQEKYPFLGVVIGDKTKLVTDSDSEFYDSEFEEKQEKLRTAMNSIGLKELRYNFDFEGTKILANFMNYSPSGL